MDHPITAAYFFRFTCPDCGFENMAPIDEFAVSFLNLNLDGTSVQAAYAGRQLPPKLSKLFQEPAGCEIHGKSRDYCDLTKCFSSDRRDQ